MKKSSKIGSAIAGVLVALILFEAFNIFGGFDFIKAASYKPSSEMEEIINSLGLTDRGSRIFRATSPNLESSDEFNVQCNSNSKEIYVLGCYQTGDDKIHLYNVSENELDGVKESTAAHELLHAVYQRLPFWERSSLNVKLKEYYDSLDEKDDVKESMALYEEKDFYDELHSRLGTEIKDLSSELEKHYGAIFNDQDKIVDFYKKYSGTFKKYEEETKTLGKKIEALKEEIDKEEKRLNDLSSNLNAKITDYNYRVNSKKYTSIDAIIAEGNNLQNEVNSVNSAYNELNKKIKEYNELINKYNSSVVRTNQIYDSINSNSNSLKTINN